MEIQIDERIRFEVTFDPWDREAGYDDDVRFTIHETADDPLRVFAADVTSILLTPDQAELFAHALLAAAEASRNTPWDDKIFAAPEA